MATPLTAAPAEGRATNAARTASVASSTYARAVPIAPDRRPRRRHVNTYNFREKLARRAALVLADAFLAHRTAAVPVGWQLGSWSMASVAAWARRRYA